MKILLTGATGYIGKRLIPELLNAGHELVCCVRDKQRFVLPELYKNKVQVIEVDFLNSETTQSIPLDIDAAYYLIHSMSASTDDFEKLEADSAENFKSAIEQTHAKQVIYLSGIVNDQKLSKHLGSRKAVEEILAKGHYALTTLRAGIVLGSGSASFEIIRDLVEKLPLMIAPKWLLTKSQPIAVRNVVEFLSKVLGNTTTYGNSYDIGGPDILSYKQMLLQFAQVRGLKRRIFIVPVMTPKLSSYWLYFVTSTSYTLAVNLVNSMKVEVIAKPNNLSKTLGIDLISYKKSIQLAFDRIEQQNVLSSWTDALSSLTLKDGISEHINVPEFGCFKDARTSTIDNLEQTKNRIWSIGGINGWYYVNWLWVLRGFIDKIFGGVGLRRGRRSNTELEPGDALDFWRVLYANKDEGRLLLFAEMKLPGEAWLEFRIKGNELFQTATFRPLGVWGRLYWFLVLPFHGLIFNGLIKKLTK